MMHIVNNLMKFLRLNLFLTTKCHIQILKKMDDSINSKSKSLHSTNIWIDNNEVNDPHPTNLITNTINIEHYNL
jgi:hypothetical protein